MRGVLVNFLFSAGVSGNYDAMPSVLMDGWGVGTAICFLVGNGCW